MSSGLYSSCKSCYKKTGRSEKDKLNRRKQSEQWAKENKDRLLELGKQWRDRNSGQVRQAKKDYYRLNKEVAYAANARRKARKLQALASWRSDNAIKAFYQQASLMTKVTGVKYVVDHIFPLHSEFVCGLHCEANLRVITQHDNAVKGSKVIYTS